jgi:hypothetical protein
VFRSPAGKVTVEVKKGSGPDAMLAALREAVATVEAELRSNEAA